MDLIKLNGKHLIEAAPIEASTANMTRRMLHIIREEYMLELKNKTDEIDSQESLKKTMTSEGDQDVDYSVPVPSLKAALIDHISEFETELETW